jgi:hypothetical protein
MDILYPVYLFLNLSYLIANVITLNDESIWALVQVFQKPITKFIRELEEIDKSGKKDYGPLPFWVVDVS